MKEKVVWGLKILAIFAGIFCITAVVWYFWQKKALENKSMDFLKEYNMLAHPRKFYDKKKTKVSEKEVKQWDNEVKQRIGEFMKTESREYKRIYEEMKEIFLDEVKMKPEERIKTSEESIKKKYSCRITLDTAMIDLLVEETMTKYNGTKGTAETEYIFSYIKENNRWVLIDLDINFPTL